MAAVLFAPLNTNHVRIFAPVIAALAGPSRVVCHDRVSESTRYHTGALLRELGLERVDFPREVRRDARGAAGEVAAAREIGRGVEEVLDRERPRVLVLAIDHDPIAILFIRAARRRGVRVVVVQEALIRPRDLEDRRGPLRRAWCGVTAALGAPVGYGRFGAQPVDAFLLSGRRAREVLVGAGVPEDRTVLTGQPRYDALVRAAAAFVPPRNPVPVFLFAAPSDLLRFPGGAGLLRALAAAARGAGVRVLVKLHPRGEDRPEEVRAAAGAGEGDPLEVLAGGETEELLRSADGLVTISSTTVLEALLLGRECVVLEYLAGKAALGYGPYGAVHVAEREGDVAPALGNARTSPTPGAAKRRLLEDELYLLDGRAAERVAAHLEKA